MLELAVANQRRGALHSRARLCLVLESVRPEDLVRISCGMWPLENETTVATIALSTNIVSIALRVVPSTSWVATAHGKKDEQRGGQVR